MTEYTYTVSAVVRDMLCTDEVQAVSDKQAWFFFCKKNNSFQIRDFKIIDKVSVPEQSIQLAFNI